MRDVDPRGKERVTEASVAKILRSGIVIDAQHGSTAVGLCHPVEASSRATFNRCFAGCEGVTKQLGGIGRGNRSADGLFDFGFHLLVFCHGAQVMPMGGGVEVPLH